MIQEFSITQNPTKPLSNFPCPHCFDSKTCSIGNFFRLKKEDNIEHKFLTVVNEQGILNAGSFTETQVQAFGCTRAHCIEESNILSEQGKES